MRRDTGMCEKQAPNTPRELDTTKLLAKVLTLTLLVTVSVGIAGCAAGRGKQVAEQAVKQFHEHLDTEQYDQIYISASEAYRKRMSEADSREYLAAIHRKLGSVKAARETGFIVSATTWGTRTRLQYDTEFTEGNASETFVFSIAGETATLQEYDIESTTLVTK